MTAMKLGKLFKWGLAKPDLGAAAFSGVAAFDLAGQAVAGPATGANQLYGLRRSATRVVAIADDDREFLRSVRKAAGSRRLTHYAAAAPLLAAAAAARLAGTAPPWDAVLIALGLPDLNGIATISRLKALYPGLKVWVSACIEEPHSLIGAICAGADGYLIKRQSAAATTPDFSAFERDRPPFGARLAVSLLKLAGDSVCGASAPNSVSLPPALGLSRAQLQLLQLLANGDSPTVAAGRMVLSTAQAYKLLHGIYQALRQPLLCTAVPQALRASLGGDRVNGQLASEPISIGRAGT